MKKYTLNKEELEILEAFENGERTKSEENLSQYVKMAKNTVGKQPNFKDFSRDKL